ncbi:MAG: 3'-5' exonuclease [Bacteroidota bacterium]|nr:3'-5' exonuclease [Bacteroidota bacterium]
MFLNSITKEELDNLPLGSFTGRIVVVNTEAICHKAVSFLSAQKALGFDTETRPSFKKGQVNRVALLQLGTPEIAFLFRLNQIGLPKEVATLLSNEYILKIGAAIHDDIKHLQKLRNFVPKGFMELQHEVKQYGIEDASLKKIAGIVLGIRISKSQRLSNWEADILTEPQQAYAATDAWVAVQIYNQLILEEK